MVLSTPLLLLLLPVALAAPGSASVDVDDAASSASFNPLAIVLTLLPFPLLAAAKYAYLRFRRAQSIHALDSLRPKAPSPVLSPSPSPSSSLWLSLHPYLVGALGSPDWETTISCRITSVLRRAQRPPRVSSSLHPPSSPSVSSPTDPNLAYRSLSTTRSAGYTSYSSKSRATTSRSSRSNYPSISLVHHRSRSSFNNDFALLPLVPPSRFLPPPNIPQPAHLSSSSVRFSLQPSSPTLMQMIEPVLSSYYHTSPKPPLVLLNDHSISSTNSSSATSSMSAANSSQDKSTSSNDTSLPFFTPLASPSVSRTRPSLSSPSPNMPFAQLRKKHALSAASSTLTISAASAPSSPASISIAVFHSPNAPSIPVPKPIPTPTLRPESCVVLSRDWQNEVDRGHPSSLLQSPTHRSPASAAPLLYDCLAVSLPRTASGLQPLDLSGPQMKATPKLPSTPVGPSIAIKADTSSPRTSAPSSSVLLATRDSVASTDRASTVSPRTDQDQRAKSWDLNDLADGDGKLDVDAVTRALGIGIGLGLSANAAASRGSGTSFLSISESGSAASTSGLSPVMENPNDEDVCSSGLWSGDTFGWGGQGREDGLATFSVSSALSEHIALHGQQLSVIMEETRSEVSSIVESVRRSKEGILEDEDEDLTSMEMDSGVVDCETGRDRLVQRSTENRMSGAWDYSWQEGDSSRRSIGVAC